MERQKSPDIKGLRHLRRIKWYWITLPTLSLLAAAILISLPYGIEYAAERWLLSHGLEVARVEDVDFNPFTGTLVLHDLQAKIGESQVLHIPEASMRFHWRPIFNKRALIEKLSIKDTTVIVDHDERGHWRIGGLALAAAETVAEQPRDSTWGFSLNQIEILNSRVEHVLGAKKVKLSIEKATMSRLRSWDKEQAARLDFEGRINEAKLRVQADFFPFANLPSVKGNVELEPLSLHDFAELASPYLSGSRALLSINSSLEVKKENDRDISLLQDGTISFGKIKVPQQGFDITGREVEWDGALRIQRSGMSGQGKLKGADLSVNLSVMGLDLKVGEIVWAGQATHGKENQPGLLQVAGDLGLRQVNMDDPKRKLRLVGMGELNFRKISTRDAKQIKLPEVQVEQLDFIQPLKDNQQATADSSLFTASRATVQNMELAEGREIAIESLELSGINSFLRRDSQGKWQPLAGLLLPVKEGKRSDTGKGQRAFMVKIGQVKLADQGKFRLEDKSVSPPFKTTVTISEATLTGLDSGKPEQSSTMSLVGKIDDYADVSIQGTVTPFTERLGFDLVANIDDFDLPGLSPYLVQLIGYKVKTGHLDADIELRSLQGNLEGKSKLKISDAEVAPADAEVMERFERQLRVPLPTALAVLMDSKNRIKLKVPITGDVTDPQFNFTDAFNQALVKGMTKAAVSYLKYIFQPYGTMMTVVELAVVAGKKITALRLDPVFFDPGSDTISDSAISYLERVAELMKTRPEIRIKVCGLATEADKSEGKKSSGNEGPVQPTAVETSSNAAEIEPYPEKLKPLTQDDRLGSLAKQRAAGIKEYLVKNHGIEDDRLMVCLSEYDGREKATPRVELLVP
jgi:hypothetical protein